MNYTKEFYGQSTIEDILNWVKRDNEQPTIMDELRKKMWEEKADLIDLHNYNNK